MSERSACPDSESLQRLSLGKAADREVVTLEAHVLACERCLGILKALPGEDELVAALSSRPACPEESTEDAAVAEQVMQRLRALGESAFGPRTRHLGEPGQPDREAVATESFTFLSPAQEPDEIGRLGPYRVLHRLGAGGMGIVFLAEDALLRRPVALKVMKPALASQAPARQRFLREARAAAAVAHDHIVTIHQVGEIADTPFLAMQYLPGETLEARLRHAPEDAGTAPLPLADILHIGREIAEGLAAAHDAGLTHRDIKPTNIWLEAVAGRTLGRVKILDFGLARSVSSDDSLTDTGMAVGTPAYMAPEQFDGRLVGPHSDLYALGCVLWRAATGELPAARERPLCLPEAAGGMPPRFVRLLQRLLALEPGDRPASAHAVAAELQAIETEQALPPGKDDGVASSPPSAASRGRRRRATAVVAWLGLALLPLAYVGDPAVIRIALDRGELVIETQQHVQVTLLQGGKQVRVFDTQSKRTFDIRAGDYELQVTEVPDGVRLPTKHFTLTRGGREVVNVTLERTKADSPTPVMAAPTPAPAALLDPTQIPPRELVAAGHGDPHQAPSGLVAVLGDSRLGHWAGVLAVAFSPDGQFLASTGADRSIRIWDTQNGDLYACLLGDAANFGLTFSPDGRQLAAATHTGLIRIWDVAGKKLLRPLHGHRDTVRGVAFRRDGLLAGASADGTVRLWDASGSGVGTLSQQPASLTCVAFRPDGNVLASGDAAGKVVLWDLATRRVAKTLPAQGTAVRALAFHPDGDRLAVASDDGKARVWDLRTGHCLKTLSGTRGSVLSLAYSAEGGRLHLGDAEGMLTTWDLSADQESRRIRAHGGNCSAMACSPDGRTLATGGEDGAVRLWDTKTGAERLPRRGHTGAVRSAAVTPDGQTVVTGGSDTTVRLWDLTAHGPVLRGTLAGHRDMINSVVVSTDGKRLASGSHDHTVRIWDLATGKPDGVLIHTGEQRIFSVAFSPDGQFIATGSEAPEIQIWSLETQRVVLTLAGHMERVNGVCFSPDGRRLASVSHDTSVRVWDVLTGKQLTSFKVPPMAASVAFHPDGTRVAAGCDPDVLIREWATGLQIGPLLGHNLEIDWVAFSPGDGVTLATAGADGTVRLWDTRSGSARQAFQLTPYGFVARVLFTIDSRHLITANGNGTAYVIRLSASPG